MRIWTSVVSILILILSLHSPVWAEAKELELSHDYQRTGYSYHGIRTAVKASTEGKEHYGYIDEEGTIIVECAYRYALDFINEIGVLWYEQPDENNILCIAVDTKGKTIIEFDREVGYVEYYDGLHGIAVNNENHQSKYALLDANGNLLTDFIYDDIIYNQFTAHAEKIDENVLLVQKGDLYGFIDWDGNIVVPVQYSIKTRYSGFKDDSKLYPCYDQSGKGGYINTSGQIVIPFQYDEVNVFDRGYAAVKKDGYYGFIDKYGAEICDHKYDRYGHSNFGSVRDGLIVVGSGVYTGAIDIGGNEVIPVQYRGVSFSSNGMITLIASDSADLTIRNPICAARQINIFITNAPLQPFPVVGPADGSKEPYLGTQWIYTDQEPFIDNGRTMIPLRAVEDISGHTVQWNEADRSVILRGYNSIISLKVDSYEAGINTFDDKQAKRTVILDVAPKIINGRTFVPLRFITEATGAKVDWDPVTNSVLIENESMYNRSSLQV